MVEGHEVEGLGYGLWATVGAGNFNRERETSVIYYGKFISAIMLLALLNTYIFFSFTC